MLNVLDKYRKTTKYDENAQIILDAFIEQLFSGKFNDIIHLKKCLNILKGFLPKNLMI